MNTGTQVSDDAGSSDNDIDQLRRSFSEFQKRLDEISHKEDVLLNEIRERLKQTQIDKLMKQLKDTRNE